MASRSVSEAGSEGVPPLTRGSSTSSSAGSANTDMVSALDGGYVLESQNGVLTVPNRSQPHADLLCPFQILDCEFVCPSIADFNTHVLSHFRGRIPPLPASCFLCDRQYGQLPADEAWSSMLHHLATDHFRQGERLALVRTDFRLMRWMFSERLISLEQFSRTQLMPLPTLLPTASGGQEVINVPEAPMPPPSASGPPPRIEIHLAGAAGHQNEPVTVQAGRRAERRRRDATRFSALGRVNL